MNKIYNFKKLVKNNNNNNNYYSNQIKILKLNLYIIFNMYIYKIYDSFVNILCG
jgi:hypothetical protein